MGIDAEAVTDDEIAEDTFDESPGSSAGTVSKYQTQMPICVSGMEYDAGQMEAFLSTDDNAFNFTAQIYHDTANAELTSIAWAGATWEESEFCEAMESLYGSTNDPVSCVNCMDTITYALYTSDSVRNNVQIGMIMVVFMATLLSKW